MGTTAPMGKVLPTTRSPLPPVTASSSSAASTTAPSEVPTDALTEGPSQEPTEVPTEVSEPTLKVTLTIAGRITELTTARMRAFAADLAAGAGCAVSDISGLMFQPGSVVLSARMPRSAAERLAKRIRQHRVATLGGENILSQAVLDSAGMVHGATWLASTALAVGVAALLS